VLQPERQGRPSADSFTDADQKDWLLTTERLLHGQTNELDCKLAQAINKRHCEAMLARAKLVGKALLG